MGGFSLYHKVIIVTRKTMLEELIERHGSREQAEFLALNRGQSFREISDAHHDYHLSLTALKQAVPRNVRMQAIERSYLPTFLFSPRDLVVTLGPDGLVVNVAKYLSSQPILAFNPDPQRVDGVLVPFGMDRIDSTLNAALFGGLPVREYTMARAVLDDGQTLDAVNDLFIGVRSHASARYCLGYRGVTENQSSSGIIVSTGAGSTGWFRSVLTASAGVVAGFLGAESVGDLRDQYRFDAEARELRFAVREPFISRTSSAEVVYGQLVEGESLDVVSQMAHNGVIFSDGMEADFLKFESGVTARITIADRRMNLFCIFA
jgi:NAD kinase